MHSLDYLILKLHHGTAANETVAGLVFENLIFHIALHHMHRATRIIRWNTRKEYLRCIFDRHVKKYNTIWGRQTNITIHTPVKIKAFARREGNPAICIAIAYLWIMNSNFYSPTKLVPASNFDSISLDDSQRFAENSKCIVWSFKLLVEERYPLIKTPILDSRLGNLIASEVFPSAFNPSVNNLTWVDFPQRSIPLWQKIV